MFVFKAIVIFMIIFSTLISSTLSKIQRGVKRTNNFIRIKKVVKEILEIKEKVKEGEVKYVEKMEQIVNQCLNNPHLYEATTYEQVKSIFTELSTNAEMFSHVNSKQEGLKTDMIRLEDIANLDFEGKKEKISTWLEEVRNELAYPKKHPKELIEKCELLFSADNDLKKSKSFTFNTEDSIAKYIKHYGEEYSKIKNDILRKFSQDTYRLELLRYKLK